MLQNMRLFTVPIRLDSHAFTVSYPFVFNFRFTCYQHMHTLCFFNTWQVFRVGKKWRKIHNFS